MRLQSWHLLAFLGILGVLLSLGPSSVLGQDRDREDSQRGGDGFRGGFPGGGEGFRGGFRGGEGFRGGPPFGGGPPSGAGPPFGGGGFGPADFLRRLDQNGNGMLDPDETQGRARFIVERIAENIPQLDLSRPIPIDRLAGALERSRGGDAGRGGSDRRDGSTPASPEIEPLVPGFGIDDMLAPPPGFGAEGELFSVRVVDDDRREADERFRRYDGNRDGFLTREEASRGRWGDDPFTYDRNGDGRLSPSEMAVRYAQRRLQNDEDSSSGNARSSRSSSTDFGSSSGGGVNPQMEGMVRGILERYDTNRSGVLERDEWRNFRTPPDEGDTNGDNRLTQEELAAWMANRLGGRSRGGDRSGDRDQERGGFPGRGGFGGFGGGGFGGGGFGGGRFGGGGFGGDGQGGDFFQRRDDQDDDSSNGADRRTDDNRKSYRVKTATERLPEGLPSWFARDDANGDGQVAMAEFAASWSATTLADFAQFDLNGDGVITPQECLTAKEENDALRGIVSVAPAIAGSSPPAGSTTVTSTSSTSAVSTSTPAASPLSERYLRYSQGQINSYDKNGDGELTEDEWNSMSKNPASGDADGNGRLTVQELAAWYIDSLKK